MIKKRLENSTELWLSTYAIIAAFGTYFCMYGFRKPFSVATFEDLSYWGIDYKILLIITQVIGYMLSKFIGIRSISSMSKASRVFYLITFILLAEFALLLFAIIPKPYNIICLFFNGLPLGMIWGIVFSYLEGRRTSEVLGAGLSASFIISSGVVKSVGKYVEESWGYSEFWMPFVTGLLFLIPLFIFTYLLNELPPPNQKDILERTNREPMNALERKLFFKRFGLGLVLLVGFYMFLTAFRDFRDNFMVEIWQELGYTNLSVEDSEGYLAIVIRAFMLVMEAMGFDTTGSIFAFTETIIGFTVLIILGSMMLIKNNQKAFVLYHWIIVAAVILIGLSTLAFQVRFLNAIDWMILVGLGLYVAYVPFGCLLFDRMLAAFRYTGTAGFMIYVADAFGYLGSVGILLYKNFGQPDLSWLDFFIYSSYFLCISGVFMLITSILYFKPHLKSIQSKTVVYQ